MLGDELCIGLRYFATNKIDLVSFLITLVTLAAIPEPVASPTASSASGEASERFARRFRRHPECLLFCRSRPRRQFPERRLRVTSTFWRCGRSACSAGADAGLVTPVGNAGGTDFADRLQRRAFDEPNTSGVGDSANVGQYRRQRPPFATRRGTSFGRFVRESTLKAPKLFRPGATKSAGRGSFR